MTVAIITSTRFKQFYSLQPVHVEDDPFVDLCDIAALVWGDRIEKNDFALPELLSGPVDADKIDYMIRDAHACGISIGVDVARIFVRAGVYEGPASQVRHLNLRGYDPEVPIKLFVVEQSGTDAVRELGNARLSLYERVYNHQLTRGAQAAFNEMILEASKSGELNTREFSNYFTLWQSPEDVVLSALRAGSEQKCKESALSLLIRTLPKRAGCFGRQFLIAPESSIDIVSSALQDAYEERLQNFASAVLSRLEEGAGEELREALVGECERVKTILKGGLSPGVTSPEEERPGLCRLLPYPQMQDSAPPPALVIRGNRIERFGDQYFSYLYAGETSSQIGYVLAPDPWREITVWALQKIFFLRYGTQYEVVVQSNLSDADDESEREDSIIRFRSYEVEAIFRPMLSAESVGRQCKVSLDKLSTIRNSLKQAGYFDSTPQLIPFERSDDLEAIAERFREVSGDHGWKVKAQTVSTFITQFPPAHRSEIANLLRDQHRFLFLSRVETISLLVAGLTRLKLEKPIRLVPLSPSSGQNVRNHIRSAVEREGLSIHASLAHAIASVQAGGGSIAFLDDNIASGTQASRQLDIYFGGRPGKAEGNYFVDQLNDEQRAVLRTCEVGAAFAIGHEIGRAALADAGARNGVRIAMQNIVWGRPINDVSGKGVISEGLREFLQRVGETVLRRRFEREGEDDPGELARERALGYSNLEGLVVTSFNVPTSTYPALWCPGIRQLPGAGADGIGTPWVPLFLRTGMLEHLVLG